MKWTPQAIDAATQAFPARVAHLMPPMGMIPSGVDRKWTKFVTDWFFCGLKDLQITPKDGIDPDAAMRHLKAIMGSYEPKHEHKEAAVSYLASLWFDDVKYEVRQ